MTGLMLDYFRECGAAVTRDEDGQFVITYGPDWNSSFISPYKMKNMSADEAAGIMAKLMASARAFFEMDEETREIDWD